MTCSSVRKMFIAATDHCIFLNIDCKYWVVSWILKYWILHSLLKKSQTMSFYLYEGKCLRFENIHYSPEKKMSLTKKCVSYVSTPNLFLYFFLNIKKTFCICNDILRRFCYKSISIILPDRENWWFYCIFFHHFRWKIISRPYFFFYEIHWIYCRKLTSSERTF